MMGKKNFAQTTNLSETLFVLTIGGDKLGGLSGV